MLTISERLKFARERREWTQAHLAVAAGVSTGTIGNIESGARQSKGSLPQIAEALGISHKWLATGQGTPDTLPALLPPPNTPPALAGGAGGAMDLGACIEGLAAAMMQSDPVDRAAAKAYLIGLCDAPDRLDLRDKIRATLEPPPAQKHTPETGAKRAA